MKPQKGKWKKNKELITAAEKIVETHPLFAHLLRNIGRVVFIEENKIINNTWCQIKDDLKKNYYSMHYQSRAEIIVNFKQRLTPHEWAYLISLALLHLGLNHIRPEKKDKAWMCACEIYVQAFSKTIKFGKIPEQFKQITQDEFPTRNEEVLHKYILQNNNLEKFSGFGIGNYAESWVLDTDKQKLPAEVEQWRSANFVKGLKESVKQAVAKVSNQSLTKKKLSKEIQTAHSWIISSFPLLSAMAASFTLFEDEEICNAMHIEVAAIHPELHEIYINPRWNFDLQELIFILTHEMLHVGLRHDIRAQGRDPYFWNVACDYVINAWLIEMNVGTIPTIGMLYDEKLVKKSAEDIYDEIVNNLRWQRKLKKTKTPRTYGKPDIITEKSAGWWTSGEGMNLDAFYRRCLYEGQRWYEGKDRGFLPAGLIEEIRKLNQPPIKWDVELAHWLDRYIQIPEKKRSYSRMSRRQSTTPDIPRPRWVRPEENSTAQTFAAVLDTSGSMTRQDLGKAIGAISSYAMSREVIAIRLVYCDATPYDAGYVTTESLLHRVEIKGRGGTILQPAINLLEKADDFPPTGPILIITDGYIDHIKIKHKHAYLLPKGCRLPFKTNKPVFYFE